MQVFSDIENILLEYNIPAAAYHGGKLNGGIIMSLFTLSTSLSFEAYLLFISHPDRCSSDTVIMALH
jgi:hypothetical protein